MYPECDFELKGLNFLGPPRNSKKGVMSTMNKLDCECPEQNVFSSETDHVECELNALRRG
jgi:hypothetical protein